MDPNKSLDFPVGLVIAMLRDVQTLHTDVFTPHALSCTTKVLQERCKDEGVSFLTKTLPKLGKALDRALAEIEPMDAKRLGFNTLPDSNLPMFLGELFQKVLSHTGVVLSNACVSCIRTLRQVLYCFYKYELPYDKQITDEVLQKFEKTEEEISPFNKYFNDTVDLLADNKDGSLFERRFGAQIVPIVREARRLLQQLFANFDPLDIFPRHGPGAVAEKLEPWEKYLFKEIPSRLADVYSVDAYFYASLGHVCDAYNNPHRWVDVTDAEPAARVCLVPKDSRGPRIISAEPLVFQWVQQGLRMAIYRLVEDHPLTREEVRFTDQQPNQFAALLGSMTGSYATLDLQEASDRITVGLVRLLFPSQVLPALMASRSLLTQLPSGKQLRLNKFAPMGSALCFPIMALTIWSLLKASQRVCRAANEGCFTRECAMCAKKDLGNPAKGIPPTTLGEHCNPLVYVYGDDVIVKTANAAHAISVLEAFGLRVNRDKSCTSGFFRESCGTDAYKGVDVTPVRIKTVWSSHPSPDVYVAYVDYARAFFGMRSYVGPRQPRRYMETYHYLVSRILETYDSRFIPDEACPVRAPRLPIVPLAGHGIRRKYKNDLQTHSYLVYDVVPVSINKALPGWSKLLRWFAEAKSAGSAMETNKHASEGMPQRPTPGRFSVGVYTLRATNKLVVLWRCEHAHD